MKKFLKHLRIFLLPAILYLLIGVLIIPQLLTNQFGPNTKHQIVTSFEKSIGRNYEMIVLGNSRTYRGVDPDCFDLNVFNFSHDNDSYNQVFYKLKYLEKNGMRFNYLILGVDYFQFSFISNTRNYVYGDYLGDDYLADYKDYLFYEKLKYNFDYLKYLNPRKMFEFKLNNNNNVPHQKENGQYIKHGLAKESDSSTMDISRLRIQVNYFEKILDFCQINNIKVFMVMLPVRKNELKSYNSNEQVEFRSFIKSYTNNHSSFYFDFSLDSTFSISDYTDITHLNELAASRFSKMLSDSVIKHINIHRK